MTYLFRFIALVFITAVVYVVGYMTGFIVGSFVSLFTDVSIHENALIYGLYSAVLVFIAGIIESIDYAISGDRHDEV